MVLHLTQQTDQLFDMLCLLEGKQSIRLTEPGILRHAPIHGKIRPLVTSNMA